MDSERNSVRLTTGSLAAAVAAMLGRWSRVNCLPLEILGSLVYDQQQSQWTKDQCILSD